MPNKQEYIQKAEQEFYKTYNRFPVIFDHGDGVFLYDTEGEEYLDFGAGIAVMGLGYNDKEYNEAVKTQVDKLLHTSNLFYNVPSIDAGEKLLAASGMDKVKRGEGCVHEIIAMRHSFHGRSMGALSVTGNDHYQEPFKPLIPGIKFADFNDLDSVKALVNENTCAVIMETVQGEGGIYPAEEEFLKGVRALCDEHGMLLILDEIQCGMGRTGSMFAWQQYGVKPNVMTVAKALGNGVPVGAFLASGKAAEAMVPGDHGTTYGGNPLVTAAADTVLSIFEKRGIVDHVNQIGGYLWKKLDELADQFDCITVHRGMGLMQGLEFHMPVGPIVQKALLEEKLVLISAGSSIIRFVPPLIIEKEHVDEMVKRLANVLKQTEI